AQGFLHVRNNEAGMAFFQKACNGPGKRLGLLVSDCGVQGNINLKALGPRGLGKSLKAELGEDFTYPQSNLAALHDGGRSAGIKIESDDGWTLRFRRARKRGVKFEISKVA